MAGEWDGFNERALRILQLANQAALSTRSNEICTEHLLLALIRLGTGTAPLVLKGLGVKLPLLKSSILSLLPLAPDSDEWRKLPFSALAERVFDIAREEVAAMGQNRVGSEHLLLGLLKIEEGRASKLLADFGVTYNHTLAEMAKISADWTAMRAPRSVPEGPARKPPDQPRERSKADPHLIEQTRQQIRKMVVEIADLAKRDVSPQEFYQGFLDRVVCSLAASGGAVWLLTEAGDLRLEYQINLRECLRDVIDDSNSESFRRHVMLLQKTLAESASAVVEPRWAEADGQASNPSDALLVLGVLKVGLDPKGMVEIFQRPGAPPTTQRGYQKFVEQMCEIASRYLEAQQ